MARYLLQVVTPQGYWETITVRAEYEPAARRMQTLQAQGMEVRIVESDSDGMRVYDDKGNVTERWD